MQQMAFRAEDHDAHHAISPVRLNQKQEFFNES